MHNESPQQSTDFRRDFYSTCKGFPSKTATSTESTPQERERNRKMLMDIDKASGRPANNLIWNIGADAVVYQTG